MPAFEVANVRRLSPMSVVSTRERRSHRIFLAGVSLLGMLVGSNEAFARALNGGGAGGAVSAPNIAADAASQAAQQAAAATRQTQDSLARAARAVQDMQSTQAAARAAAAIAQVSATAPVTVPNGLGAGGLLSGGGWIGANAPTQGADGKGQTEVNIRQTMQQAILNWQSFNVGPRTTLTFDQQGNRDWVALNRVTGVPGQTIPPSQILGNIKADGHVYVINQSGIIFGGASQVNVGSLIASTAGITDSHFRDGIFGTLTGTTPSFTAAGGKVTVEAGASINTRAPTSVTSGGGFVLMIGSEVSNAGSIGTPKGQTILAAGDDFVLRRGFATDANTSSTTRGIEIAPRFVAGSTSGTVSNRGLVFAQQGDVTLAGRTLTQDGLLIATTSVNTRGTIHLSNSASDSNGSVALGAGSLTAILPEVDSKDTALDSQRDGLIAASAAANLIRATTSSGIFDNLSLLADRQDQSRIEIVTGGTVTFEGGSHTAAQGGQIAVSAGGRIFTEQGAHLDVSGVRNVALAMASNNIKINVQGNELRDSPLNRDAEILRNNDVWIDVRTLTLLPAGTGGYASDRYYTSGGLLEVGGYLTTTPHTIGEWSAIGGTITLQGPEVIAQRGAVFDLSGGSLDYAAGWIRSTNLIGNDGRRYSADKAPGDMKIAGYAGAFARQHQIQGRVDERLTEVWTTIFDRGRTSLRWEDGYSVGRDAGRLILSVPTAVFEADILTDTITGRGQTSKRANGVTDGYKVTQTTVAQNGALEIGRHGALGLIGAHDIDVRIGEFVSISENSDRFSVLPAGRTSTVWLDAGWLNEQRLGKLDIATGTLSGSVTKGSITIVSDLKLADGGIVNLVAPVIDIKADITAHGGAVTATNQLVSHEVQGGVVTARTTELLKGDATGVRIHAESTIDTRGVWTNATLDRSDLRGLAFIDGGDVKLQSTGNVTLDAGSRIDTSSGGAMLATGKTKGGTGGNVTLRAGRLLASGTQTGVLTLRGDIRGYGVNGGGTLSLQTDGAFVSGGNVLLKDGELGVGEVAIIDLVLDKPLSLQAGDIAPIDITLTRTSFRAGETLDRDVNWMTLFGSNVLVNIPVGSLGWTIPSTMTVFVGGTAYGSGQTVPAGATVTGIRSGSTLPAGYRVSAGALPNGLPVFSFDYSISAGDVLPEAVTLPAGSLIPAGTIGAIYDSERLKVKPVSNLVLPTDLLRSGFTRYEINARQGVAVIGDTVLAPVVPVLGFTSDAHTIASGTHSGDALAPMLMPLFMNNPRTSSLMQRPGADLVLSSGLPVGGSDWAPRSSILIGEHAQIVVDPGRAVRLEGGGQITVEGRIEAAGGSIVILNKRQLQNGDSGRGLDPHGLSIWIGAKAVLDAAGRAYAAVDIAGRQYGTVLDGGSILLGSEGGSFDETGQRPSADAFIVVRPGALLDVSGASLGIDQSLLSGSSLFNKGPSGVVSNVASDGGSIVMRSYNGIYNEGTLLARSGGAGAAGGSLILELETPIYYQRYGNLGSNSSMRTEASVPNWLRSGRVLTVTQGGLADTLPADLVAGRASASLAVGYAGLSVKQIEDAGFDSVALSARNAIVFDGDISLRLGRSLTLAQGTLNNTSPSGVVSLSAPYVLLDGHTSLAVSGSNAAGAVYPGAKAGTMQLWEAGSSLAIDAGLIDVKNRVHANFAATTLSSMSDLRFLAAADPILAEQATLLASIGDLTLIAGQIYPASNVVARVYAGASLDWNGGQGESGSAAIRVARSRLTIGRPDNAVASTPYSLFGDIHFSAGQIVQGGTIRAPLGAITLEGDGSIFDPNVAQYHLPSLVELLPGSITSVSASGLVIPYGGTADGVSYLANGRAAVTYDLFTGQRSDSPMGARAGIRIMSSNIVTNEGSLVDVSGGGALAGAAFVQGRGGSVDTLLYPLVASNPANSVSSSGNTVYAILPGVVTAPMTGGYSAAWTGATPDIGRQVTISHGVPGLPAGTYTLLPANYALLPGAFRVEIGASSRNAIAGAISLGSGSYVLSGIQGIANTAIRDTLTTQLIVTSGAVVRTYSQYNETGYADFQTAQAAITGAARPLLERDGRFLEIALRSLTSVHDGGEASNNIPALVFDGKASFASAPGGYAGALLVNGGQSNNGGGHTLRITGPNEPITNIASWWDGSSWVVERAVTAVAAATINAIGAPSVYIGGTPTRGGASQNVVTVAYGGFENVVLGRDAVVKAGQIIVTSNSRSGQGITFEAGAGLSTLGMPGLMPDSLLGVQYGLSGVVASSGWIDLAPMTSNMSSGTGLNTVTLQDGAFLYADGTVGFTAHAVDIQGTPRIAARYLALSASAFNIYDAATVGNLASALPAGLTLTQGFLTSLLQGRGDPDGRAPAAQSLTLTAGNLINFIGDVAISTYDANGKSLLDELVLNSPAIYGLGTGHARVTTDTLVWNGNVTAVSNGADTDYLSTLPGAVTAGGPGTGSGILDVHARQIVLGYPRVAQARNETEVGRLLLGFSDVNFVGSERIVSNNTGRLNVYQSGPSPDMDYKAGTYTGTGGNLNLVTPLLTGEGGSTVTYRAGGRITVKAPDNVVAPAVAGHYGAVINLAADSIDIATNIALPSGRLTLTATNDILLRDSANIDLAGRAIQFYDVTKYSRGGDVVAESTRGNILMDGGARIHVSAQHNDAGSIKLTATDAAGGNVRLLGTLSGATRGEHAGGSIDIRAQTIGDGDLTTSFAVLNTRLNDGGFLARRSFVLKQGNLVIGDELRAQDVNVSVDGGSLTVVGLIDAHGSKPGRIALAATNGLTIASTARLDVHGTVIQVDSYGAPIDASNRGHIELTAAQAGRLVIEGGATFDLSSPDGIARGQLNLNAWRTSETGNDVKLDVTGLVNIIGAKDVAVYGLWSYSPTDADGSVVQDNGTATPVSNAGIVGLDQIDAVNRQFMSNAAANADLSQRLGRLPGAKLLPGVNIVRDTSISLFIPPGTSTVPAWLDASFIGREIKFIAPQNIDLPWYYEIFGGDGMGPLFAVRDENGKFVWDTSPGIGYQSDDFVKNLEQGKTYTFIVTKEIVQDARVLARLLAVLFPNGLNLGTANSNGNITVKGDIDLSRYRYGSDAVTNPTQANYGAGSPGKLVLRAAGDLTVNGSISDGFALVTKQSPATYKDYVVNIATDAHFQPVSTRYDLRAGQSVIVTRDWTITVADLPSTLGASRPQDQSGRSYAIGETVPVGTVLTYLRIRSTSAAALSNLFAGSIDTPGQPIYVGASVDAPMLAAGSRSWSIILASGADVQSANANTVRAATTLLGAGNLVLSNPASTETQGVYVPNVIRTGTGDLSLLAGGDITMKSLYGVYTAGSQINPAGVTLSANSYIADGGGDLRLNAQGDLTGYVYQASLDGGASIYNSSSVGHWLLRTGNDTTSATWSINFGSYALGAGTVSRWYGFTGFGALGGGNVAVDVGGNAGVLEALTGLGDNRPQSAALVIATGASGYVTRIDRSNNAVAGGALVQAGGGDLGIRIGGKLNPGSVLSRDIEQKYGAGLNGVVTAIRGEIGLSAAAIGTVPLAYGESAANDARAADPYAVSGMKLIYSDGGFKVGAAGGGLQLVLGDASARLDTLGDLVLTSVGDPGQLPSVLSSATDGWFTLWRPDTGIELLSAGGNLVPMRAITNGFNLTTNVNSNTDPSWSSSMLPASFEVVAAGGSILYGTASSSGYVFELAPSPKGKLSLLARDSIFASADGGYSVVWNVSGADWGPNAIPNPFRPATAPSPLGFSSFYAFGPDSVGTAGRDAGDPIRLYAANGDIVNALLGQVNAFTSNGVSYTWYVAAPQPGRVLAGRDLVNFGTGSGRLDFAGRPFAFAASLILNRDATDVSVIRAGRDILHANVQIGGPGSLDVVAGRNLYQADKGSIASVGSIAPNDSRPGASILMQAGAGANGPNYAALLPYLDPANLALVGTPLLDQPGKVAKTYETELRAWLKHRYSHDAASDEAARAYFAALAPEQQQIFLRQVYFAELRAGGREYNDVTSSRYGSYLRGRQMIAALFPDRDTDGNAIDYRGDMTMFGGSGVRTLFGGGIEMLTPGGQQVIGVEGVVPAATAGVVTQGAGDISIYSKGSVLLGLSRIMTTFGGNVLAWSAEGDINAGRGSKTTVIYTPPKRVYDDYGNVTLSPDVPSSGAGIATLNPVPEVDAGDIDLIAPLGTIDAGEAGIRVSGNINLAALQILNAANIQVQGTAAGIPAVQAPSITAALTATNATAATQQAAAPTQSGNERPSVIIVEVLGYGGGSGEESKEDDKRLKKEDERQTYNRDSNVRVLGYSTLSASEMSGLNDAEKAAIRN
ncbi:MAG: filamentous hemagglutinin [Bradyrhizobiaceae bacterium PARB1]|nr:MAG: filamentous hemagglutinin [Bradyrhizobiaceae bacterium PARB1]